jgi:hypothetical protein
LGLFGNFPFWPLAECWSNYFDLLLLGLTANQGSGIQDSDKTLPSGLLDSRSPPFHRYVKEQPSSSAAESYGKQHSETAFAVDLERTT